MTLVNRCTLCRIIIVASDWSFKALMGHKEINGYLYHVWQETFFMARAKKWHNGLTQRMLGLCFAFAVATLHTSHTLQLPLFILCKHVHTCHCSYWELFLKRRNNVNFPIKLRIGYIQCILYNIPHICHRHHGHTHYTVCTWEGKGH